MDLQWTSIARTGSSSSRPIFDEGGVELIGSHRDIASFSGGATGVDWSLSSTMQCPGQNSMALEVFEETRPGVPLVEAAPRILPAPSEKLANAAREELESLDVR